MQIKTVDQLRAEYSFDVPVRVTSRINGVLVPAGEGHLLPIIYPATNEQVSELQEADAAEVGRAVAAARAAFDNGPWPKMSVPERQAILRKAQQLIAQHQEELAYLECLAAGLPMKHLQIRQVPRAAENFGFFAEYIGQMAGESFEQLPGYLTVVTRQPAGVAALIAPWNAPLALSTMQIASCISFGNTCVLKPSEYTPLAIGRMVELLEEAGIPPGVVNIVNGRGHITGDALVGHPDINRIAFTGGTPTARMIMAKAAQNLTPVHFELGGKSANVVFADADFEQAIDGSLINIFSNNGQICIGGSRILVQREIAERFIEAFVARTNNLLIGDPMDPASEIGPLAFKAHFDRVVSFADWATENGLKVLAGGEAVADCAGNFFRPTVVQVDDNSSRLCQEEIFGPFTTIQIFDTEEEALAIANDSDFGLVAYLWTENLGRVMKFQQGIEAGTLWVNTPLARDLRAPFGGVKDSGIGRDGPRQCAEFYTEEKATIVAKGKVPLRKIGVKNNAG